MLLLDVRKAFDSVDHTILTTKLEAMGIDSTWFASYLQGRSQCVNIGDVSSGFNEITCGVPQGSILGPLLYLCYCNDMELAVEGKLLLYADDSAILISDKDPSIVAEKLHTNLSSTNDWLIDNRLSMHAGKTELIIFSSKRRLKQVQNFSFHFEGIELKAKTSVKYLGVKIDRL